MLTLMAVSFTTSSMVDGQLSLGNISGPVCLISFQLYAFIFNATWGPVMWVMLGEMFPNQIRGSGLAVSGFAQWISNFLITMTFPILLTGIGLGAAYGIYAGFAILSFIFIIRFVKETKGLELEEMNG